MIIGIALALIVTGLIVWALCCQYRRRHAILHSLSELQASYKELVKRLDEMIEDLEHERTSDPPNQGVITIREVHHLDYKPSQVESYIIRGAGYIGTAHPSSHRRLLFHLRSSREVAREWLEEDEYLSSTSLKYA